MRYNILTLGLIATTFIVSISARPSLEDDVQSADIPDPQNDIIGTPQNTDVQRRALESVTKKRFASAIYRRIPSEEGEGEEEEEEEE